MNFYNPYYYNIPTNLIQPKVGLLGRLFGKTGVSISNFLNGTQKVLNIANQTIPIVKQVKPMIHNTKTMFKVMNEFKRVQKPNQQQNNNTENTIINDEVIKNTVNEESNIKEGPTFFI